MKKKVKDVEFINLMQLENHQDQAYVEVAVATTQLPHIQRGAFDRFMVLAAPLRGMMILMKDRAIPSFPKVKVVWE